MTKESLVLLHGLVSSPRIWSRLQNAVADDPYDIFAPQLGNTDTVEDEADHVAVDLHSPAIVVGHSMGGSVGTALAQRHPDKVARLILLASPPNRASRRGGNSLTERGLRSSLGPVLWQAGGITGRRRGLRSAFVPGPVPEYAVDDLSSAGLAGYRRSNNALNRFLAAGDLASRLSDLHCPIEVCYGLDDCRVYSEQQQKTCAALGIEPHALPHVGHAVPWEAAGFVAALIRSEPLRYRKLHASTRPALRPVRWNPPKAPARAKRPTSTAKIAEIIRVELPGRGPEDVRADRHGRIFTGLEDGRVLRVQLGADSAVHVGATIDTVADTGGRPLGISIVDDRTLLVCDSERGLLRVDTEDASVAVLVDQVDGNRLTFASNVVTGASGRIYFTASTQRFGFEDYLADLVEHSGTGRLFALERDGSVTTMAKGLNFANGVSVSPDESYLDVAETGGYRVLRYSLAGDDHASAVTTPIELAANLPGFPDNISLDSDDLLWVALANPRNTLLDLVCPLPGVLRKATFAMPESWRAATRTLWVIALNSNGEVVHDLQSTGEEYAMVTGVTHVGAHLVLSSITESALAVIAAP